MKMCSTHPKRGSIGANQTVARLPRSPYLSHPLALLCLVSAVFASVAQSKEVTILGECHREEISLMSSGLSDGKVCYEGNRFT